MTPSPRSPTFWFELYSRTADRCATLTEPWETWEERDAYRSKATGDNERPRYDPRALEKLMRSFEK